MRQSANLEGNEERPNLVDNSRSYHLKHQARIMPLQETATWQFIAKIVAPIVASIGTAIWWLIRKWVDARFKSVEDRVDQNENDIKSLKAKSTMHEARLAEHGVHLEHIRENTSVSRESIRRLHDKLDDIIASSNRN